MIEESLRLILVHGTWAQNAPWTQETSPIVTALRNEFVSIKSVKRIDWSGRNSFAARFDAREKLVALLSSIPPGEKAIICAHSHGGGAVCYALQERPELADKIEGLVFLATPFCTYRLLPSWRLLLDGLWAPLIFAFFALYIMLFVVAFRLLSNVFGLNDTWAYWGAMAWFVPVLCGAAVVCNELALRVLIVFNRAKLRLTHGLLRSAIRTGRMVSCELPNNPRAVFIRLSGDEARQSA